MPLLILNLAACVGVLAGFFLQIPMLMTVSTWAVIAFTVMSMSAIPFVECIAFGVAYYFVRDWFQAAGLGLAIVDLFGLIPGIAMLLLSRSKVA